MLLAFRNFRKNVCIWWDDNAGALVVVSCEISVRRGLGCLGISIPFRYIKNDEQILLAILFTLCSLRIFEISFTSSSPEKLEIRLHNFGFIFKFVSIP